MNSFRFFKDQLAVMVQAAMADLISYKDICYEIECFIEEVQLFSDNPECSHDLGACDLFLYLSNSSSKVEWCKALLYLLQGGEIDKNFSEIIREAHDAFEIGEHLDSINS